MHTVHSAGKATCKCCGRACECDSKPHSQSSLNYVRKL